MRMKRHTNHPRNAALGLALLSASGVASLGGATAATAEPLDFWVASGCVGVISDTSAGSAENYFAMSELEYLPGHECRVVVTDAESGNEVADVTMSGTPTVVFLPNAGEYTVTFADVTWDTEFEATVSLTDALAPATDEFTSGTDCRIGDSRRSLSVPTSTGEESMDTVWTIATPQPVCEEHLSPDVAVNSTTPVAIASDRNAALSIATTLTTAPDSVNYLINVANPSLVPLNVTVRESSQALAPHCPDRVLAPGGEMECTAQYSFTATDDVSGAVRHVFQASGVDSDIASRIGATDLTATAATDALVTTVTPRPRLDGRSPEATVGVTHAYTYSVTGGGDVALAGALPPGLSLSSSGELSGIPTEAGTFSFTLHTANERGSHTLSDTLTVKPPASLTPPAPATPASKSGTIHPESLAVTGARTTWLVPTAGALLAVGATFLFMQFARRSAAPGAR